MKGCFESRNVDQLKAFASKERLKLICSVIDENDEEIAKWAAQSLPEPFFNSAVVDEFGCGGSYDYSARQVFVLAECILRKKMRSLTGFVQSRVVSLEQGSLEDESGYVTKRSALGFAVFQNDKVAISILYRGGGALDTEQHLNFDRSIGRVVRGTLLEMIENNPQDTRAKMAALLDKWSGKTRVVVEHDTTPPGIAYLSRLHFHIAARRKEVLTWLLIYRNFVSKDMGMLIARILWESRYEMK